MNIMEIDFTREFELNEETISKLLEKYGDLSINDNIFINLTNIKKHLSFIPIKSESNVFRFSNPLGSIAKEGRDFVAYVGNKKIVTLSPQYFKMNESCTDTFDVVVDGVKVTLNRTSDIIVNDDFNVIEQSGYRVNVIGFTSDGLSNESGVSIKLKDFDKRFSIDVDNKVYRVEFYKNNEFCHMSKVHFIQDHENE